MFDDFERVQLEMNICNKTQINVSNETRLVVCEGVFQISLKTCTCGMNSGSIEM